MYICNVYLLPTHFSNLENASLKTPLYAMPINPHLMSTHHFMPTKHHFMSTKHHFIPTNTPLYANKYTTLCQQKHHFIPTKTPLYVNKIPLYTNKYTTLCQQIHLFMPTKTPLYTNKNITLCQQKTCVCSTCIHIPADCLSNTVIQTSSWFCLKEIINGKEYLLNFFSKRPYIWQIWALQSNNMPLWTL